MNKHIRRFIREMKRLSNSGKFIIGITGTIGSGKTTVLNFFADFGFFVVSADDIAKKLLTSEPYYSIILARYPEVADPYSKIDRKALARLIFNNKRAKEFVEDVIHPGVVSHIIEEVKKSTTDVIAIEAPLLFEVGLEKGFDLTICIFADEKKILRRLVRRGWKLNDIKARMNSQLSHNIKLKRADIIIFNNEDIKTLRKRIYNLCLVFKNFFSFNINM